MSDLESCCGGFISAAASSGIHRVYTKTFSNHVGCTLGRELTCGFAVLGLAQVAQGTFVVAEVIEGDPCPVHGLEVVPLMAQHLQAVLLHSLVVDQLRLQQASCRDWRIGVVGGVGGWREAFVS